MKLPVHRQLPYISPSTFMKWLSCQHRVYLSRLAGLKYAREPAGLAASYGSSFDSFIKAYIADKLGMKQKNLTSDYLISQTVDKDHQEVAIPMGQQMAEWYIDTGLCDQFITSEVRLDIELYGPHKSIPMLGQLDLIIGDTPMDWKTGGFTSRKGRSPKVGYEHKFVLDVKSNTMKEYKPSDIRPLEETNPAWATQMCIYNWLLHNPDRPYLIHEIVQHNDKVSFAVHRGNISQQFNDELETQIEAMWGNIHGEMFYAHIQEPTPSKWTCHKYGVICEVHKACTFYMDTLGNPDSEDYQ